MTSHGLSTARHATAIAPCPVRTIRPDVGSIRPDLGSGVSGRPGPQGDDDVLPEAVGHGAQAVPSPGRDVPGPQVRPDVGVPHPGRVRHAVGLGR